MNQGALLQVLNHPLIQAAMRSAFMGGIAHGAAQGVQPVRGGQIPSLPREPYLGGIGQNGLQAFNSTMQVLKGGYPGLTNFSDFSQSPLSQMPNSPTGRIEQNGQLSFSPNYGMRNVPQY